MSEWKKYEGTDEQIAEMLDAEHGFIIRSRGIESKIMHKIDRRGLLVHCDEYLICNPNPLADMIERWAETGQPVWIRMLQEYFFQDRNMIGKLGDKSSLGSKWWIIETNNPDWNIPGAEYSFTPFGEEK